MTIALLLLIAGILKMKMKAKGVSLEFPGEKEYLTAAWLDPMPTVVSPYRDDAVAIVATILSLIGGIAIAALVAYFAG